MLEPVSDIIDVTFNESESLYIWLDLLGFSKELEKSGNKEDLSEKLEAFRSSFRNISNKVMHLSDGILIAIDITRKPWNINSIRGIFTQIAEGQINFFVNQQQIVRGGIGIGETINEDNWKASKFISSGMAKAYGLESKKISWPVIGMDQDVLSELSKNFNASQEQILKLLNLSTSVNEAGDTIYFIDFAKQIQKTESSYKQSVEMYFSNKIDEFEKNVYPNKVRLKYIWLYKYFKQSWGIDIPNYKEWVL